MEEALLWGAFFDWLLSNPSGITTVIVILAFAIPSFTAIRRLTKGHVSKGSCTVQTVGFIRSTQQTGLYVNGKPAASFLNWTPWQRTAQYSRPACGKSFP